MTLCHSVDQRGLIGNETLIEWHISLYNHFFQITFCLLSCLRSFFVFFEKCYVLKIEISYLDFNAIHFSY